MIIGMREAIEDALQRIQNFGFIVMSAHDNEHIEVIWMKEEDPPDIDPLLNLLRADGRTLEIVLEHRKILVPMWLVLGYPWEHPVDYWKKIQKEFSQYRKGLHFKKRSYAAACILFHSDKQDTSWKEIGWEEPWPILK